VVEIETRCRIPIWRTFGRIQWCVIPEPHATLQGVRIPSALLKIVFPHLFYFLKCSLGFDERRLSYRLRYTGLNKNLSCCGEAARLRPSVDSLCLQRIINGDGGCRFWQPVQADSQPKSSGLVLGRQVLGAFYIHQMNLVNCRNGSAMMTAP